MISAFIILYLLITIIVGWIGSRRVKTSGDFILAGKKLPLYLDTATVFATWFGSESVLGASSQMSREGFLGVIEDPFGAALCLLLVGLFFARPLYRMNLITFGDFYRIKYNRTIEVTASILLVISYIGWIAAQMLAMGIVLNVIFGISVSYGILIGSGIVIFYTIMGGMWSIALTDLVQSVMIIAGLIFVFLELQTKTSVQTVIQNTPDDFFRFIPYERTPSSWLNYLAMWITIGLGSIAGQDVFQRVMSAKNEKVAVQSSVIASMLYLTVVMIPLLLALYARFLYPELMNEDSQMLLPNLVKWHTHPIVCSLFFGALLSAIMSTASGSTLAPASILSENLIKPLFKKLTDKSLLFYSRLCVLVIAAVSMVFAFSNDSIFELVALSSQMTLVTVFVPLIAAMFFKSNNSLAAFCSMIAGFLGWVIANILETEINSLLYGLFASILAFVALEFLVRRFGIHVKRIT